MLLQLNHMMIEDTVDKEFNRFIQTLLKKVHIVQTENNIL